MKKKIQSIIEDCLNKNPCEHLIYFNEPMKEHTTFKVGGPVDCLIKPYGDNFPFFCADLLKSARNEKIPVFILGAGANIVVSDKGIRGITLDMNEWKGQVGKSDEKEIVFKSGTTIEDTLSAALDAGLGGLEFLAGMPGTVGGSVYMNARCYGSEIADILNWTEILISTGNEAYNLKSGKYETKKIYTNQTPGFGYKQSPFQKMNCLILSASFNVKKDDENKIFSKMEKNKIDRAMKGQYMYPSAGSVFKNNHEFGKPTGAIIDGLGLKGLKIGGAQVAEFHGNIIINNADASASDIRSLVNKITLEVKEKTGFTLEPEVLFIGDWT
ncbi:MAG: UDP-N-acetylmuramate dehydrogenase [Treponema sp.]|nr:UDP-N-acetylmuramate dehydrogenase [Treponema sp.]